MTAILSFSGFVGSAWCSRLLLWRREALAENIPVAAR